MAVADDLCDRVGFIDDGGIAVIDEPRALRHRYGSPTVRVELRREGRPESEEFPWSRRQEARSRSGQSRESW